MMTLITGIKLFKLLQILLLSGIKFFFAPLISVSYGYNYFQTILITSAGGILGIVFFFFFSRWLIRQYNKFCPVIFAGFTGKSVDQAKRILNCEPSGKKKIFTAKSRKLIRLRRKYGYPGIIILTPVLLSIPIGAFLAQKYYSKRKSTLLYMSLSIALWSFFISSVYFLF
jgi:hypothetical protein